MGMTIPKGRGSVLRIAAKHQLVRDQQVKLGPLGAGPMRFSAMRVLKPTIATATLCWIADSVVQQSRDKSPIFGD